ncbi:MAG: ABC-F family ATP-binding cassette domain-containing protein [Lentisphaerae bacterium]|nr:ABC-F family ATP-binding cassette domain-containing protein [Lentisphaerota bacterium]
MLLRFDQVSFTYASLAQPLFEGVSLHCGPGWTGIAGANGAGKSTLLKLAIGELEPQRGRVQRLATAVYAPQRTDDPPPDGVRFLEATDVSAGEWRGRLRIGVDWLSRWETLSHGERKRLQIGAALWRNPELLALDEPTNHIDAEARALLLAALRRFRGVGLLVSHDRALLDALCMQCVFIDPPDLAVRPGGVTAGLEQQGLERQQVRAADDQIRRQAARLERAAQGRREAGAQAAAEARAGKRRKIPSHDPDGRAKRNLAKLTNKDGWAAKQSAVIAGRAQRVEAGRAQLQVRKTYEMGFWIAHAGHSTRNTLLDLDAVTLSLGDGRQLHTPPLRIGPTDRIALVGPNGSGKSTLLRHLHPLFNLPPERIISIPQEIDAATARAILRDVAELPRETLGKVMTSVSRLGSRPGRLITSEQPSPGEIRKIMLALGVVRGPHLIVMDEPTNHMDLPSIGCVEEALAEAPCALLLVSHDRRFLDALAEWAWTLEPSIDGTVSLRIAPWRAIG